MLKLYHQWKLIFLLLFTISLYGVGSFHNLSAQIILSDNCNDADAAALVDLNDLSTYPNMIDPLHNIPANLLGAGFTNSGTAAPECGVATPTVGRDAWVKIRSDVSGSLVISYSPSTASDVSLALYSTNNTGCGAIQDSLLRCSTNFGAGITESVSISARAGDYYFIRIINEVNADVEGSLTIYPGPQILGDLCTDAINISLGTCDFPFNVSAAMVNTEGFSNAALTCLTTEVPLRDAWAQVRLDDGQEIRIDYQSDTKDAAIAIYTTCDATGLPLLCQNAIAEPGVEALSFTAPIGGDPADNYLIRVMNIEDTTFMTGSLCVREALIRDDCAAAIDNATPLELGDCNIRADILSTYGPHPGTTTCLDLADPAGFMVYNADADREVRIDFAYLNNVLGDFALYEILTADLNSGTFCTDPGGGGTLGTEIFCEAASGTPSFSTIFDARQNHSYIIRIQNPGASQLLGSLCIYDNSTRAEDNYVTSPTLDADGGNCGSQFNILAQFNPDGGLNDANVSCAQDGILALNDAWVNFEIGATLPDPSVEISFNNDNDDVSVARNAALLVYQGESTLDQGLTSSGNCIAASTAPLIDYNQTTTFEILDSVDDFGHFAPGDCLGLAPGTISGDAWIRFNSGPTPPSSASIVYEPTGLGDAIIQVFREGKDGGICGNFPGTSLASSIDNGFACVNDGTSGTEYVTLRGAGTSLPLVANSDYYIRILKVTGSPATMTGTLKVISPEEIACVDGTTEGTEFVEIQQADLDPSRRYYVRAVNVDVTNVTASITGNVCIKDGAIEQGDVCNTATGLLVGDCDINFNIPADPAFPLNLEEPFDAACVPTNSNFKDGWASFTALSTETTVEYFNQIASLQQDAILVIYRGACSNLIYVDCVNDIPNSTAGGLEQIKINTIVGLQYFVRVINDGDGTEELVGSLCIYNTSERDICEDDELQTLSVGDCNIPFDVPDNFILNGPPSRDVVELGGIPFDEDNGSTIQTVESACDAAPTVEDATQVLDLSTANDAFIRVIGNGNRITLIYQNSTGTGDVGDPAIKVYTSLQARGPVNCGVGLNGAGNPDNQYACSDNIDGNVEQTESVTFQTRAGQQYIVRIINKLGTGMQGILCVADGENAYPSPCPGEPREIEVGDCSIPLNVVSGLATCFNPATPGANFDDPAETCDDCAVGDSWATFTRPLVCDQDVVDANFTIDYTDPAEPTCNDLNGVPLQYSAGPDGVDNTGDDRCICLADQISSDESNQITIQYDNRDNRAASINADVRLVVYRSTVGFDCDDASTYDRNDIVSTLSGTPCADDIDGSVEEGVEEVQIQNLDMNHGNGGEVFYIRVINKSPNKTAFGTLCTFYGTNLANENCPPPNDYGALEGNFRYFEIPGGGSGRVTASQQPQRTIPECVLPGGSNPKSNRTTPIRADAWMRFFVPASAAYDAVTVQFDNTGFSDRQNAAIAVYDSPANVDISEFNNVNCNLLSNGTDNLTGLRLVDCVNTVYLGAESVTVAIERGRAYYVRVMNIHNVNNPKTLSGRIRVFPFAACNEGPELVIDGNFALWPAIERTGVISTTSSGNYDTDINRDIYNVPFVTTNDARDLDQNISAVNTGVARFATDYGFLRDRTRKGNLPNGSESSSVPVAERNYRATYGEVIGRRNELNPEGLYLVRQTPWTVKGDWFCYGLLYSGYGGRRGGGRPTRTYCRAGEGGAGTEPCVEVTLDEDNGITTQGSYLPENGQGGIDRPFPVPSTSDANFMIVNGSFDPNSGLPPGKVWCQTIQRGGNNDVSYFIFTVWVQNMISGGRNLDVPQLRLTVCDMTNPQTDEVLPPEFRVNTLVPDNPVIGANGLIEGTLLPGVTLASENLGDPVYHAPLPPNNRLRDPRVTRSYGAAMPCNLPSEERDARLKILGSSFIIPETPDQWRVVRCIYRAPKGVSEMNICIENLSLTKNGNDFGIDGISFRECENADVESFDRLLKGDPCELANGPEALSLALSASLLDFTGRLINDVVALDWITIDERNSQYYEIQRSTDGTNFYKIGGRPALPQSPTMNEYRYIDNEIPEGVKYLYYRLNILNANGTMKLGPVIQVDISGFEKFNIDLIQNPALAGDEVEVKFDAPIGNAQISLTNLMGDQVMLNRFKTQNGSNSVFIKTGGLSAGIYIVEVIHEGKGKAVKRLVIL